MKPDPKQRRTPPAGALAAVVREGRRRRARGLAGVALGLAVLGVVAAVLVPSGDREPDTLAGPAADTSCPDEFTGEVPALPLGFDGSTALAPVQPPVAVLVCRYPMPGSDESVTSAEITFGLDAMAEALQVPEQLPGASRVCPLVSTNAPDVLARLTYRSGAVLWLASRIDLCSPISNGEFTSLANPAPDILSASRTGVWPLPTSDALCPGVARRGLERQLLLPGWSSLSLCTVIGGRNATADERALPPEQARAVAGVIAEVATAPSQGSTSCRFRGPGFATLRALYPDGRATALSVMLRCEPALDNGFLAGNPTLAQRAELVRLLQE